MKTESSTKVAYRDPEDQKIKITSETAFNKKLKEATDAKEPLPEIRASQTFSFKYAENVDEAVELAGGNGTGEYENIEVFLGVFNYGATLRQHNAANDLLTGDSFVPTDGAMDVSYAVAEKVERAKMSPEEKAVKSLAAGGIQVSVEALRAALELIRNQKSVGA
jgi:hypothetical protein